MAYSKLSVGDNVIQFELKDKDGNLRSLNEFKGKRIVLYFYPKDDTPGCTIEGKEFSSLSEEFKKLNCVIIGISPDSPDSHAKFCAKHDLSIILLSDQDHKVSESYWVWGKKKFMGKEYFGIMRTTFLIGSDGKVKKIWEDVKPEGHSKEVLEAVKSLVN